MIATKRRDLNSRYPTSHFLATSRQNIFIIKGSALLSDSAISQDEVGRSTLLRRAEFFRWVEDQGTSSSAPRASGRINAVQVDCPYSHDNRRLDDGIDGRIMIVGLPTVAAALHADAEQAIWFIQAYIIGSTIALLFVGRVNDMVGKVRSILLDLRYSQLVLSSQRFLKVLIFSLLQEWHRV